jgi:hypothetical protein
MTWRILARVPLKQLAVRHYYPPSPSVPCQAQAVGHVAGL